MADSSAGFKIPEHNEVVTVADMAQVRKQGYDDGFQEGQDAGYQEGLAQGKAAMQQQLELELAKIRQLIQAMQQPFEGFRQELVNEVKDLTRHICESFLRHKIQIDTELLMHLVDESLKQLLPTDHQIVVHSNQHNGEVIQNALADQLEPEAWRLKVNAKLSDTNVFIESGHSRVKIDLDQMLQEYLAQTQQAPSQEKG